MVLSSQRVDLKEALYNALKRKERDEAANPLVQNGLKLVPSVTRVFRRGRPMYVYLQAYEQGSPATEPLVAFIALYAGPKKVFETPPIKIAKAWNNRVKTMPISFDVSLAAIAPGEYACQVTVLNPAGQRAAFWQAPVAVRP